MKTYSSEPPAAHPYVLLIGPEDDQRAALRSILIEAGYRLLICSRLCDAADLIQFAPVVISEYSLPDGSWLDVLQAARRLWTEPAVIVTARAAGGDLRAEVLALEGYEVLTLPARAGDVLWAVQNAHRRHPVRRESGKHRTCHESEFNLLVAGADR